MSNTKCKLVELLLTMPCPSIICSSANKAEHICVLGGCRIHGISAYIAANLPQLGLVETNNVLQDLEELQQVVSNGHSAMEKVTELISKYSEVTTNEG